MQNLSLYQQSLINSKKSFKFFDVLKPIAVLLLGIGIQFQDNFPGWIMLLAYVYIFYFLGQVVMFSGCSFVLCTSLFLMNKTKETLPEYDPNKFKLNYNSKTLFLDYLKFLHNQNFFNNLLTCLNLFANCFLFFSLVNQNHPLPAAFLAIIMALSSIINNKFKNWTLMHLSKLSDPFDEEKETNVDELMDKLFHGDENETI